jgi:hypothetical protein
MAEAGRERARIVVDCFNGPGDRPGALTGSVFIGGESSWAIWTDHPADQYSALGVDDEWPAHWIWVERGEL